MPLALLRLLAATKGGRTLAMGSLLRERKARLDRCIRQLFGAEQRLSLTPVVRAPDVHRRDRGMTRSTHRDPPAPPRRWDRWKDQRRARPRTGERGASGWQARRGKRESRSDRATPARSTDSRDRRAWNERNCSRRSTLFSKRVPPATEAQALGHPEGFVPLSVAHPGTSGRPR